MRLEAKIYALIGDHPRIPKIINWDDETCCLTREYLENGNLKEYVRENGQTIALHDRIRWCLQATEGLSLLHGHNVVHCNVSPRNFLLDSDLNLRISDFGGASLSCSAPSATADRRFLPPGYDDDAPPVFQDDIFGLGSLVYFIMTGYHPYEDMPSDQVEKLYETHNLPDVSSIVAGDIITQCWLRQAESAQSIYTSLAAIEADEPSKSI
ncbi:kinase-like domain-containing protein [Aspergillus karnatakaensis]|uniref:serine/threonine protein kinase n=1 Tax=Aspergillus karnatakaensis TaxID=1810916 RepID=UPI003CCD9ADA